MSQQRKFFPGWLVVTSGFVIMATCYTIFVNCMSLFQPLIVSDLGISLAQYNISNAISTVVSVVGSLVIGHVADKVSGRVLGSLTVIATSAVLAGMSFVGELWQVYVLFAVSGCFAVASTRLLISLVTANWFTAKRGLAISIALSGSGFGGAILSPIVSSLIVSVGWRSAFLVLAAVCMVAALPITAYSFRTKPSEIGLKPLGENPGDPSVSTAGDKDEHTAPEVSVGWSRIKKSPAFWLLVVAFLFMGLVNGAILPNQVTNMTSVTVNGAKIVTGGHDPMWAGTVLSAYMVTVVIAKISLGAIYDRFGLRFGNILGSIACIIACVALCFPTTDLGPIVAAVSFGIGTCMGTITPTIAASEQFGMADLGKVTGTITSLEMVGGTVGARLSQQHKSAAAVEKYGSNVLKLYLPGEYLGENVISDFEKQYGVRVIVENFDSNEMMYTKLMAGDRYDVIIPSDYMIERLMNEDFLQPLDKSMIPNMENMSDAVLGMSYDPDNTYSIPYFWGSVGLVYNHENVDPAVIESEGWEVLRNTDYAGHIYIYDSERDSFMMAFKALGYSMNTEDPNEINDAYEWLLQMNNTMSPVYVTDEVIDGMMNGYKDIAVVYSGDAAVVLDENEDMSFYMPSQGTNIWCDAMVIPANAENPKLAHEFINYMLTYEAAFDNTETVGYTSPNAEVFEEMTSSEDLYADNAAYLPRSGYEKDEMFHDNQVLMRELSKLWIKVKAAK